MSFSSCRIDTSEAILDQAERFPDLPFESDPHVPEERRHTKGYYLAMILVFGVWMITPLSW